MLLIKPFHLIILSFMDWEVFKEILLDSLKDSGMVFGFVFIVHILLAFFEEHIAHFLVHRKKTAPLYGSLFGLIPQCGTSVLGADLYLKKYVTIGTLSAIFLSCSDEAFIVLLTQWNDKTWMIFPLMGLKFSIGFLTGIVFDYLYYRKKDEDIQTEYEEDHKCHQHHNEENTPLHRFFIHPLIHSLEIFIYVFLINLALGMIIESVGPANFESFITSSKYFSPLYSAVIGLIPNCASSILITELFIGGNLSFGALLSGLLVNSGLGLMILLKNKNQWKNTLLILVVSFIVAVISGYITCLISGF